MHQRLGEDHKSEEIIQSKDEQSSPDGTPSKQMAHIDPEELVGLEFEMPDPDDGKMKKMTIMKEIKDHKKKVRNESTHHEFMLHGNVDNQEEMMYHDNIIDHMEKQREQPLFWEPWHMASHQGSLSQTH